MSLTPVTKKEDWESVRRAIQKLNQKLSSGAIPTFAGVTLGNTGLHLLDTNASHDLIIAPGSDLTADRILTITTGDSDRTITLSGNPTLADWFDQSVKQAATPTFAGLTIVNAVTEFSIDGTMGGNSNDAVPTEAAVVTYTAANYQPLDADLTSIALLGSAADKMLYTTNAHVWAETAITAAGRAILDDANAAAQCTTLGLGTGDTPTFTGLIVADDGYIGSATSVDAIQIEADGSVVLAYDLTAVSFNDLYLKLVATRNIGIGSSTTLDALDANPEDNIAIGVGAGSGITNGDVNIFIGTSAGYSKTTSSGCVAIGHEAAYAGAIVGGLTAIGYQAMRYHTGGNGNTAVGYQAGLGAFSGCNYTYNTFIGEASGVSCHQGGSNTCLGKNSGHDLNDGHRNIFLGFSAGYKQADNSDLVIIDNQARADAATELTNAILYGVMAAAPADQTLRINADLTVSNDIILNSGDEADIYFRDGATPRAAIGIGGSNNLTITSESGTVYFGNDNIQTGGDITTSAGDIKCKQLTLSKTTQDYLFTDLDFATTALALQSQTEGSDFSLNFYAKTGDGTEAVQIRFWAKSTPAAYENYESLQIGYTSSGTKFMIYSAQHGTGIVRPIHIYTEGNDNQMVFQNDGDIEIGAGPLDFTLTMANSTKDPTTDAPADWVEVKIGGTTYYLPAYAAS